MTSGSAVVLISGIQGTGKTTLARAVARQLGTGVFSRDPFMRGLVAHGIPASGVPENGIPPVTALGYAMQTVMLEEHLTLHERVVLECIMTGDIVATWTALCREYAATLMTVECVCSDRGLHRERIERRYRAGESDVTWDLAGRAPRSYRTIPDADYIADAVQPVQTHVTEIVRLLGT